jgi:hypothetical protein
MDKLESYLSGLTEAEMNEAGKIEAEATAMLAKGWSREVAAMYLRIIPAIRKLGKRLRRAVLTHIGDG